MAVYILNVFVFQVNSRTAVAVKHSAVILVSVHYLAAQFYVFISFAMTDAMFFYPPVLEALYSFNLDINNSEVTMTEIVNKVSVY